MKKLALLLPLLVLAAVGCRKTTFTPDVVPASIQSYHQDPDGRLTLKIKCDSATAKGRAFLCSTKPAKGKGEPLASVRFQFYERGNIPGSEQLTLDADGTTEYSVDIDKLNAALAGIPEQARPADRILHVFINQTEVGQWNLESPPATNAVAAKEAAVRAKLDAIVFDSLEYQDANAADVISDLCERAREMDKDEPDPAKKGVSVVVGVDVKDIDEILARTTVTLKERSVSLGAALDRVADAIGLKVRVVGGCVLLGIYKGPLDCRIFPVPPDLASRFLGDGNDWKARLAEIGIEWPDGTYVRYLMSVGRLTVYNTPDDLDRIERALAEATRRPAEETHAESAEGAAPAP